jgi:hypothetical protein
MLTQFQLDNFNTDHITIYTPVFADSLGDEDKIWLTFCYMIGQQWGFEPFQMILSDYKIVKGIYNPGPIDPAQATHNLNPITGEWVKFGYTQDHQMTVDIHNPHWEFRQHKITSPRLQRIWIHLYNAVFTNDKRRNDLLYDGPFIMSLIRPTIANIDWFVAGVNSSGSRHTLAHDHSPRYINPAKTTPKYAHLGVWPKIVKANDS